MEAGEFKLQERTALLVGPCTSTVQSIAMTLTSFGCSVAMVDANADFHSRFAERLTDAREINPKAGRAAAFSIDLKSPNGPKDAVSKAAESFGGIDIYVDASVSLDTENLRETSPDEVKRLIHENFEIPLLVTQNALKFLEGRRRGRIIYLTYDLHNAGFPPHSVAGAARNGLVSFSKSLAREVAASRVTVNCLSMGVSEELLLNFGKGQLSIQAAQVELQKKFPDAILTESEKVAQMVAFLASSMGAGVSGQTLTVSKVPGSL